MNAKNAPVSARTKAKFIDHISSQFPQLTNKNNSLGGNLINYIKLHYSIERIEMKKFSWKCIWISFRREALSGDS